MGLAQFAVAAFLNAVGQVLRHLALETAKHEGTDFRRQTASGDLLLPRCVFPARFVGFGEVRLRTEVTRLNKINDAPEVQEPVFQRRACQGKALVPAQLFDRQRHLRGRVFDKLRFVKDDRAELELLQSLQVAPEQRIVGDDQVVLWNLFPKIMTRRAAFEHEHFQVRREPVGLAPPVVQNGRRADDERGLGPF